MKNIIKIQISIFMLLLSQLMLSQRAIINPVPCSSYTPNTLMDKFTGHWKWLSGNDSFEMILKKEKIFNIIKDDNSCLDKIIGFHQYVKNGIVIESSLQNQNSNFNQDLMSIYGSAVIPGDILWAGIDILSNGNNVKMEVEYIDANHIKIISLKNDPGVKLYLPGQVIPSSEITLPQNIILTKQ